MDPLSALREAIKAKYPITFKNQSGPVDSLSKATHIVLPSSSSSSSSPIEFPKSTPTTLRKPSSSQPSTATATDPKSQPQPSAFYPLEAVYLAWKLKDATGAEYMREAREVGLLGNFVSVTERKGVVDWLEGRVGGHGGVVVSGTPPGTPPTSSAALPSTAGPTTLTPSKRKYVPDPADADLVKKIRQNEVELRDRNTVLRGTKVNNFSAIQKLYSEKLKQLRETSKGGAPTPAPVGKPDPKIQRKPRTLHPIIMISSSPTSLITMHNVKKFFQESNFEPSAEARARAAAEGNSRPEDMIPIYRKRTYIDSSGQEHETKGTYFVVDGTDALAKFGSDAWDRVVAVLTTGQTWQFRPYKWSDPRALFHHVKGFYVSWANDPPNQKIKDWNVTELKIDPHRRHIDKSVVAQFWKTLDSWTVANKPWLNKS